MYILDSATFEGSKPQMIKLTFHIFIFKVCYLKKSIGKILVHHTCSKNSWTSRLYKTNDSVPCRYENS